jgi:predicted MPP superfamily phosphohydrolase
MLEPESAAALSALSPETGPERSMLHRLLVLSDAAARLPALLIALILAVASAFVGLAWAARAGEPQGWAAALLLGGAGALNWGLLAWLPRAGRSFGAPAAPVLAMSGLLVLGGLALTLLLPSWIVLAVWLASVTLVAVYATWVEPFRVQVTYEVLHVQGWAKPLRLAHLGDLHVERLTARERRVNQLLDELKPDVIAFSGDFVNLTYRDDPRAEADVRAVIGAWRAPYGVYAVPGTPRVEPPARVEAFVRDMPGITLLVNRWQRVNTPAGALQIAGVTTTHHLAADRAALAALGSAPAAGLRLLIAHSPDVAPEAAAAGFDLMLCGHTHGGQIVLPLLGPLFSGSAYGRRFIRGRYLLGRMTLYVTRGLGMEGWGAPRARLLCPPEITVWTILPSDSS